MILLLYLLFLYFVFCKWSVLYFIYHIIFYFFSPSLLFFSILFSFFLFSSLLFSVLSSSILFSSLLFSLIFFLKLCLVFPFSYFFNWFEFIYLWRVEKLKKYLYAVKVVNPVSKDYIKIIALMYYDTRILMYLQ